MEKEQRRLRLDRRIPRVGFPARLQTHAALVSTRSIRTYLKIFSTGCRFPPVSSGFQRTLLADAATRDGDGNWIPAAVGDTERRISGSGRGGSEGHAQAAIGLFQQQLGARVIQQVIRRSRTLNRNHRKYLRLANIGQCERAYWAGHADANTSKTNAGHGSDNGGSGSGQVQEWRWHGAPGPPAAKINRKNGRSGRENTVGGKSAEKRGVVDPGDPLLIGIDQHAVIRSLIHIVKSGDGVGIGAIHEGLTIRSGGHIAIAVINVR